MANPTCFSARQVCSARVALLAEAGAPVAGANNGYVTNLVSVETSVNVEEGDEFVQKDGCGDICARFVDCDKVKGVDATLNICTFDAQLVGLVTGGTEFVDPGTADVMGVQIPGVSAACPGAISLEWWCYAQDGASQATPDVAPAGAYWHFVIPYLKFRLGDVTYENGIPILPLVGKGSENPNITQNGPFNDWPTGVANAGGVTSPFGYWLESSMPSAACEYEAVTSAAS